MTYTAEQLELQKHIEAENERSREQMAEEPGLWIGMVTTDLQHWADYGITTIDGYEFYMAYHGAYESISDATSKSFARWVLQDCKTEADLNEQVARYQGE